MRWLRALSESDCYFRCYGDKTGTVDVVGSMGQLRYRPVTRLELEPAPVSDGGREKKRPEQPAEAA